MATEMRPGRLFRALAGALALPAALLASGPAGAGAASASHGIAMHGSPKYGADFEHFDYANPDAPKGGEFRRALTGTFDSLNPFIIKG